MGEAFSVSFGEVAAVGHLPGIEVMKKHWLLTGLLAGAFLTAVGCQPQISTEELGEVIYDKRDLPGAGESYDLPQLQEPARSDAAAAASAER